MNFGTIFNTMVYVTILCISQTTSSLDYPDYPEGYYPFEQTQSKNPPKVRRPPYAQSDAVCPGVLETQEVAAQSLKNLCGNLNEGFLPVNPMGQKVKGETYPFELIRNLTLDYFSKTLPILKQDETLPKVAKYMNPKLSHIFHKNKKSDILQRKKFINKNSKYHKKRIRKSVPVKFQRKVFNSSMHSTNFNGYSNLVTNKYRSNEDDNIIDRMTVPRKAKVEGRDSKGFCYNNWGFICIIYNAVTGRNKKSYRTSNRREDLDRKNSLSDGSLRPLTPCPSAVEYVTPVFARNYQGVWRYVVQIPYEGYFTQTVEITQCLSSKCHYLSGSCLSSPRWVSLLVAEIYYPDAVFPMERQDIPKIRVPSTAPQPPSYPRRTAKFSGRQGDIQGAEKTSKHCDGFDNIGCFQVRLYYDWFLVPGACKCWKQDFYAQFAVKT